MRRFLGLALLLCSGTQAQQVNVRGKVVDGTGKAVANAITELTTLKAKDTTGADGAFAITAQVSALTRTNAFSARSPSGDFSLKQGVLHWTLKQSTPAKLESFDSKGRLAHRDLYRDLSVINHRLDLRDQSSVSTGLAKVAATVDSLKVSATGYAPKTVPLSSYDTTVNITVTATQGKTSPGCGISTSLKTGNFTESINGANRRWMIDVPANYDPNKPYRLIFVWHPLGGSGSQVVNGGFNGLKSLSQGSAIFATADGLQGSNNETSGTGWWNVNGGDMKLVQAMLDKINNGLCIDQERIFSTGFSFGGMMSYTLPFEFNVFRAIAPCSGKTGVIDYTTKYTNPVPILAFHGNTDTFVATNLGKAFFDRYAARNSCGTQTRAVTPTGCVEYQGCTASSTWCLFNGGHTTWSEQPAAIWKFFSQF